MTSNGEVNSGWGDRISTPALWVPRRKYDLSDEYPTPSPEELVQIWREYDTRSDIVEAPEVYGVLSVPDRPPIAYVSLDVCEVLRMSHLAIRSVINQHENYDGDMLPYGVGTFFHTNEADKNEADKKAVLQVLMARGLVQPVAGIEEIAAIIKEVHEMGAYVFANTSTLPGCEPGTIDFFKRYIPQGLSGVVFPRDHHGEGEFTKGRALIKVIERIPPRNGSVFVIKIDDTPKHTIGVRKALEDVEGSEVVTIMPQYRSPYQPDEGSRIVPTPLDAVKLMRELLAARLN